MNKIKQNKINFTLILIAIVVTFSSLTILSIPALFNYNGKAQKIEKNFYQNFKLYLKTSGDISYKAFPKPHLLVENASLNLNKKLDGKALIDTKDLKIFVSLRDIYLRSFKNLYSTEISNTNLEFKMNNIREIRNHLYQKINKPIVFNNCRFFLKNSKEEVILISPIKNITYKINDKQKNKIFLIDGKIFSIDFKSDWKRNYGNPKISSHLISLFNPNIEIENFFHIGNKNDFKINTKILLDKEKLEYNIKFNDNIINISSPNNDNLNFKINSNIQLSPFYFKGTLSINKLNVENIIDNMLSNLILYNKDYLGNISGDLKIKFIDLNNKLLNDGELEININEQKINLKNIKFSLKNIGDLQTEINFIEKQGEIKFLSKNIFNIQNYIEFAKNFQVGSKDVKDIKNIYFDLERNIGSSNFIISNIRINDPKNLEHSEKKFYVKNIQNLRASFRKVID